MSAASRLVVYSKRTALQGVKVGEFTSKSATLLLQVRLETSPQFLPQIGEFTTAYTRFRFQPRTAEKLALASYELIENAISYGSISGDVVYSLSESDRYVEVCVANDASPGRLSNLRTRIDRIRVDPQAAFQEEMSRSVSGAGARAALGLARICHEAQMDLELEVEGNRVTMRARCSK
jgi:two-component sensor histidine kinase